MKRPLPNLAFSLPGRSAWRLPPTLDELVHDPLVWLPLVIALVVNLGLLAFLWIQVSNLTAQFRPIVPLVPLHFNAAGEPDRVDPVNSIFSLPIIGLIVLGANFVLGLLSYRRERLITYILVSATLVVQLFLWFAVVMILRAMAL